MSEDEAMTRQEKQVLIERLHDIWSTGDTRLIHEVYAESFVAHMPKGWGPAPARDGHDGYPTSNRAAADRFPGLARAH